MSYTQQATSNQLGLEVVIQRLAAHPLVDGVALFGTQPQSSESISDYDLLVLVEAEPVPIFQMLTYIDGRMADVVFYTTALVDQLLSAHELLNATTWAGYFLQKMRKAQILYDRTRRLTAIQQALQSGAKQAAPFIPTSDSEKLCECFWLNHTLLHLQRMVQSTDPIYTRTVALMLMGGLATISRSYYRLRDLPWEGEKAALRYLQQADPAYLALLDQALAATERYAKIDSYAQLVAATLAGSDQLWQPGGTAVILHNGAEQLERGHTALAFWEELLRSAV